MLEKLAVYTSKLNIKSKLKSKDGMEMLQMVMMLAIAVVLATLFYAAFKGNLQTFMNTLNQKMTALFQ